MHVPSIKRCTAAFFAALTLALAGAAFIAAVAAPAKAHAAESNAGQTGYVRYEPLLSNGFPGSFVIEGVDEGRLFQTTYRNRGYFTYARAGESAAKMSVAADGSRTSIGEGLVAWIALDDAYNGRYVRITYHVKNEGAASVPFQIGTSADVMIDNNDRAPVVGASGGLIMSGAPRNDYTFNLVAPTAATTWYGFFSYAASNVFVDLEDKTAPYSGDSGMAWSFSGTVAPGAEWAQTAFIGVGELPQAPEAPQLAWDGDSLAAGSSTVIAGTGQPGTTVNVSVAGQQVEAPVDESGAWSVEVKVPGAYVPSEGEKLAYWAVSSEGGMSEVQEKPVTVTRVPEVRLSAGTATVMEDAQLDDAWYRGFASESVGEVSYAPEVDTGVPGTYQVTYTAAAGSETATATLEVTVLPKPFALSATEAPEAEGTGGFPLASTLTGTGGLEIVETGFVYGALQQPTLAVNDGIAKTDPAVTAKNGRLAVTLGLDDVVEGLAYYARAYAKASDGTVVYGAQSRAFGTGIPAYGAFSVTSDGNGSFTIARTSGTSGAQTVYWRTASGSAVAGTHYEAAAGALEFAAGEESKKVSVNELGATRAFGDAAQTAYANADRTYFVEVYRVDGGATISPDGKRAERTMSVDGGHKADRALFDGSAWLQSAPSGEAQRGDYDDDGLGWADDNQVGSAASLDFDPASILPARGYWDAVSQSLRYKVALQAKEEDDGYQHFTISENGLNTSIYPYDGEWRKTGTKDEASGLGAGNPAYAAIFRHGYNGADKNYADYHFPKASGSNPAEARVSELFRTTDQQAGAGFVTFGLDGLRNITLGFCASGSGGDKWYTNAITHYVQLVDEKEPSILGVVADAGAAYRPGDAFAVSVVFDEIVDAQNSSLEGMTLSTTWGEATYAGGADTNVLYFTGTVRQDAQLGLVVTENALSVPASIKDMAGNACNANVPATNTGAELSKEPAPVVEVDGIVNDNGTLSSTISAKHAMRVDYAWSQEAGLPSFGWMAMEDPAGGVASTRQTEGTWYLHVQAVNADGLAVTQTAGPVELGDPSSGGSAVQLPSLEAHVDNGGWARERTITLAKSPAGAEVTAKAPGSQESVPVDGDTYTATENGVYAFALTSGDEVVTQQVTVVNIDRDNPVVFIEGAPAGTYASNVELAVRVTDAGSGVEADGVSATWRPQNGGGSSSGDGAQPATLAPVEGQSGVYACTTPGEGAWTLSVSATDKAGNAGSAESGAYTVDLREPTVTVEKDEAASSAKGVVYRYEVARGGSDIVSVQLPDGKVTADARGTFVIASPGTYYVVVTDAAGHVVQSDPIEVAASPDNPLDGVAPDVRLSDVTEPGDLNPPLEAQVAVSVYEESATGDTVTVTLGGAGAEAGGVAGDCVLAGSASTPGLYEGEFTAKASGVYTASFTDAAGNKGEGKIDIALHECSYAYAAEGAAVTETCANGCGHKATATLSVAEGKRVYTGKPHTPVTVDYSEGWAGERPAVQYEDNIDAGTAKARLAVGEETAVVEFAIDPAALEDVAVRQSGALVYTGEPQKAQVEAAATAVNDQPVSFEYRAGDENGPISADGMDDPDGERGGSAGSFGAWGASVPAFTDAGEYKVQYRALAPNHEPAQGVFVVDIDRRPIEGALSIDGAATFGETLSARYQPKNDLEAGVRLAYQWYRDGEPIDGATGDTYVVGAPDIGAHIGVKATGTGNFVGEAASAAVVPVKAAQAAPGENEGYVVDFAEETIAIEDAYEVFASKDAAEGDRIGSGSISDLFGQTVYIRKQGTDTHDPSGWTEVALPARPGVPEGVEAVAETALGKADGAVTGITEAMEYRVDDGPWTSGPAELDGLAAGTQVVVRVSATKTAPHGEELPLAVGAGEGFTVAFDAAGGSEVEVLEGVGWNATVAAPDPAPVRAGFTLVGWFAPDGDKWDFAADAVTQDIVLTARWALDAPTVELSPSATEVVYGEAVALAATPAHAAEGVKFTYAWTKDGEPLENARGPELRLAAVADSGVYAVSVTAHADGQERAAESAPVEVAVSPAALRVTADDAKVVYGDAAPASFTVSVEGWVGDEGARLADDLLSALALSCGYAEGSPVVEGGYPISVSWKSEEEGAPLALSNYAVGLASGTLAVGPRVAELAWSGVDDRAFGDGIVVSAQVANRLGEDDVTVSVEGAACESVGLHTARAVALAGADAGNYALPDEAACMRQYVVGQSGGAVSAASYGDDGSEQSAFVYGDAVTVRATVSPTGEGPAATEGNADAADARTHAVTGAQPGQMALFYEDAAGERHRVSEYVFPDDQGVYTMTYDTASRIVPARDGVILIAAFAATDEVADAEAYVAVSIGRRPLSVRIVGDATKPYDGTVSADGLGLGVALSGALDGDAPTATAARYAFDSANVSEASMVTAYGIALDEASAPWYVVDAEASAEGFVTKATQEPPKATALPEATSGGDDGALAGLDERAQWRPAGGGEWFDVPADGVVGGLAPGAYEVRYAGDENHEPSESATVTVDSFSEAHGGMVFPDGTIDDGRGSAVLPEGGGTVVLPGGSVVVLPGGSVVAPDGSVVTPGGVVVRPGDTAVRPGEEGGTLEVTFPDGGGVVVPGGSEVTDSGTVVLPGGQVTVVPGGSGKVDVTLSDGTHVAAPSGSEVRADGLVTAPDGSLVLPGGAGGSGEAIAQLPGADKAAQTSGILAGTGDSLTVAGFAAVVAALVSAACVGVARAADGPGGGKHRATGKRRRFR